MTQTQFLLIFIAILPFFNCLIQKLCFDSVKLINFTNKLLPVLFLANLIGLFGSVAHDDSYITIFEATRGISIGFYADEIALASLLLLNFFWIIFTFYSNRFLSLYKFKADAKIDENNFKMFFLLIIAFLNLIIISKNLISTLFFYNCLIFICHFFAIKFLHKKESKYSNIFTFLLYLESIFFFLAIVATYKFSGEINFNKGGILGAISNNNFNESKCIILLFLYLSGLFLSILIPSYLLYRNINFDPLVVYVLFFLGYVFSSLFIFVKLLVFIFGFNDFSFIIHKVGLTSFEVIFLLNLLISGFLLLFSKNLKSLFFYLLLNQFIFIIFTIFIFGLYAPSKVYLALFSFLLSLTLAFLCISNLILYINKTEKKTIEGLFFDLKISTSLLVFAVFNLIGIAPSIGALEHFFLIKILFKKKLLLSAAIYITNFAILIFFSLRLLYPLYFKDKSITGEESLGDFEKTQKINKEIAREIESDSCLILTTLTTAILMFLLLVTFLPLTKFFNI